VETIRSQIPDEFLSQFKGWMKEIEETRARIKGEATEVFAQVPKDTRKDFALWVMANYKELSSYLFAMLDGEDITSLIYKKAFENRPNEMAAHPSEDVA
jgi:hypothetical protein